MPSPLPGINPYLENSEIWSEFHSLLACKSYLEKMKLGCKVLLIFEQDINRLETVCIKQFYVY
ncbi:DUF4058 family protein [Dendronalium phyllosphericum]|uniref:DUF4058 family protein n=1 Tax=Dendronalium phyllosphericum TaxID=2840445 RepID=UPI001CED41CD|nr:DUF4058 family protein [Dendronalium phyllosphericum]